MSASQLSDAQDKIFLSTGWEICSTTPGTCIDPHSLTQQQSWQSIPQLGPVAACLRDLGEWSLDGPAKHFDAEDWWYRLRFDAPEFSDGNTCIGFAGLATLAEIWLNDKPLLSSNNMFLKHSVQLDEQLRKHGNELIIVFRSIDKYLAQRRQRPRWRVPMLEQQQLRWVRTSLLGRTPGWSPPAAPVGPWREIWLEQPKSIQVKSLLLRQTIVGNTGKLAIRCRIEALDVENIAIKSVNLKLIRNNQIHSSSLIQEITDAQGYYSAELSIESVDLWWPHTHGEPALYQAELIIETSDTIAPQRHDLGVIGFRKIHLNRTAGTFELQLNGAPIFCRGACWTPLDTVTLDDAEADYVTALKQVRAAGMNMLRISGTTAYPNEAFYSACAAEGIMIWQDFVFANMDYPETPEFLKSVTQEVEQKLTEWHHCPALTVLCGNSEVEQQAAMWGAAREVWEPQLFHNLLAELSEQYCPDIPYWPSSAHGGSFPHQNDVGTTSYYGVGAYLQGLDDARKSRVKFATECLAFANVPELSNIQQIPNHSGSIKVHHPRWKERVPRDLGAGWDFEDVRDSYLSKLFGVDPLQLRYAEHDRYLLLSRIVSGEVMAATFIEWRSSLSECRGGLIWFLRDLWPGAGWGIIDCNGNPKAPYYYLKRALQPLGMSISNEGTNGLFVHLINEHPKTIAVKLAVNVYKSGQTLISQEVPNVMLMPRDNQTYPLLKWFDRFMDFSNAYRFGSALADCIHLQLLDSSNQILTDAFWLPLGFTPFQPETLGLQATAEILENDDARVTLLTKRLAIAVYFEIDGFIPEDAYFNLAPNSPKTINMRPNKQRSLNIFGYVSALNSTESILITLANQH